MPNSYFQTNQWIKYSNKYANIGSRLAIQALYSENDKPILPSINNYDVEQSINITLKKIWFYFSVCVFSHPLYTYVYTAQYTNSYNQTMEEAVQMQKMSFLKKSFKIITKENLPKSLKCAFHRLVNKFKRKVETPPQATYELSIEFRTYDEDEEDTYSVVMSLENIERRL